MFAKNRLLLGNRSPYWVHTGSFAWPVHTVKGAQRPVCGCGPKRRKKQKQGYDFNKLYCVHKDSIETRRGNIAGISDLEALKQRESEIRF